MEKYRVQSAALLLLNPAGLLYCVQELQSKPEIGKIAGSQDYSVPWETMESGEHPVETMARLLIEEVDAHRRALISSPLPIGSVEVYDTLAHVFVARFVSGSVDMRGSHSGIEIEPLGFQTREFLLSRCRGGISEVLGLWDEVSLRWAKS